jgi:ATP-binding cassette subfamily F protein 3
MPSNLLLLDEPTNHLDIPAREAIESFLRETPATVLVVSHDRRLLETICDRLWVVADGLAAPFYGGYRAWRAAIADGWTVAAAAEAEAKRLHVGSTAKVRASVPATAAQASNGRGRASDAATAAATTRRGSPSVAVAGSVAVPAAVRTKPPKLSKDAYRRQKATVEAEMTRLGLRKNHLEMAIGNPTLAANFVELRRITSELADVDTALRGAEEQWLELEERAP